MYLWLNLVLIRNYYYSPHISNPYCIVFRIVFLIHNTVHIFNQPAIHTQYSIQFDSSLKYTIKIVKNSLVHKYCDFSLNIALYALYVFLMK